jgi:predicted  nucleic acid-binding Zn-ribbon protein
MASPATKSKQQAQAEEEENKNKGRLIAIIALALLWVIFSGLAGFLWMKNNDLDKEKKLVEEKAHKLTVEIDDINKRITEKETQLTTKEHEIKELNDKLKQTQARIAYLEQSRFAEANKVNEIKAKASEAEQKIIAIMEENEKLKSDLEVSKVENKALNEKIQKLTAENDKQKAEIQSQKEEIERLNKTIENIYHAYDFKFFNIKNETGVAFKKGKVKKSFAITCKITKFDFKPAPKLTEEFSYEIRGVGKKNGNHSKSDKIKDFSGGEAKIKFVNEPFAQGIYNVRIKKGSLVIGDANFMIR